MSLRKSTYQQQSNLASYCRTNKYEHSLKVNKSRIHHYRKLVYNVIDESLKAAFPLTINLMLDEEWDELVNEFFTGYSCQSAQIWRMPGEFYSYYVRNEANLPSKYPHLIDLLYFEWTEIELFMMEDIIYPHYKNKGSWVNDVIAINPEYKLLNLSFPVHQKNARHIDIMDKNNFYVLAFREKVSGKIQFLDISGLFALIIENVAKSFKLGEILNEIIPDMDYKEIDILVTNTQPFLQKLKEKGFILGFIR